MRIRVYAVLISIILFSAACAGTETATQSEKPVTDTESLLKYQEKISADFMRDHLSAFAADSMQGRETGTPGEEMAAEYLASQYRQMGLQPMGDNNTYFQNFKLNATRSDSIVFKLYRSGEKGQKEKLVDQSTASKNSTANFIRRFAGSDSLSGEIVFAGFGVEDTSRNVNHLQESRLAGKWVMVFQELPNVVDGDTLFDPVIDARARFQSILGRGAAGILLIPSSSSKDFETVARQTQSAFGEIGGMSLAYRDKGSGSGGFGRGYNLVNPKLAAQILDLDSESELSEYRRDLIANITDFQPRSLNYTLAHIPYSTKVGINSQNVLAYHEGADPELKEEVVVLTSHYDHVGIGQPDSTGDRIYNGADDDGSGTVGLLNIARALSEAEAEGVVPRRSVLFLNVSAEEKGLLGSRYYSDHPVFPMDKTVANLNTDMIGRVDAMHKKKGVEEYAYIIGGDIISSQLDSLIEAANRRSGQIELSMRYNDLNDPNQFYRRSDHWHFGRKGVPFAFFFSGIHEDYHRPSDEVHKIRFDKMAKIVRTMYASTIMIANTQNPPEVDNQEFIEITKSDN